MRKCRTLAPLLCLCLVASTCSAGAAGEAEISHSNGFDSLPSSLSGVQITAPWVLKMPFLLPLSLTPVVCSVLNRLEAGLPGVREQYDTYESAVQSTLEKPSISSIQVEQTLQGHLCTVLLTVRGGLPHGSASSLYVFYRDGSVLGDGMRISLPLPRTGPMSGPRTPDTLVLSEDGKTLSYSYHLPPPVYDMEPPGGDFHYTTDLISGITWLNFSPLE